MRATLLAGDLGAQGPQDRCVEIGDHGGTEQGEQRLRWSHAGLRDAADRTCEDGEVLLEQGNHLFVPVEDASVDESRKVGVLLEVVEIHAQHASRPVAIEDRPRLLQQSRPQPVDLLLDHPVEQLGLAAEVVGHQGGMHVGETRDVADRGSRVPVLAEGPGRGLQKCLTGLLSPFFTTIATLFVHFRPEEEGSMKLTVTRGDITKITVDAIVNAANERMLGGGGVDGAIHRAAGPDLRAACAQVPEVAPGVRCPTGEARITRGFALPARYVIHTVGPIYDREADPAALLASAHRSCLELAEQHGLETLAFPAISCGVYGFPIQEAAPIAVGVCRERPWALKEVVFVLFDDETRAAWQAVL